MRTTVLLLSALSLALARLWTPQAHAEPQPNRIKIEYVAPTSEDQKPLYEFMKGRHVLEKVQQMFSPFRLPVDMLVRTRTCGKPDSSYQHKGEDAVVTLCYEYLDDIFAKAPPDVTPMGITPTDGVVGQFFYVVGHDMGRAMFDLLGVPIFGRESDAADHFATYIMLQMGPRDARRLIGGAAYSYKKIIDTPEMTFRMQEFSDVHGTPAQRFYNMVCLAFGANPQLFADVVQNGFLPQERAPNCNWEYRETRYAFRTLIKPHLDPELTGKVLNTGWLPNVVPFPRRQ